MEDQIYKAASVYSSVPSEDTGVLNNASGACGKELPAPGTGGVIDCSFNILNTIFGSGVVALSYGLYNAGIGFGIVLLLGFAAASQLSLQLVVEAGLHTGTVTLPLLAKKTMGKFGHHLLNVSIILDLFGGLLCYLMIIGDMGDFFAEIYFPGSSVLTRGTTILTVGVVTILPLLFFQHTGPLAKFSAFSVLCIPTIIVCILVRAPAYTNDKPAPLAFFGPNIVRAMGVFWFSFSSSHAAFHNFLGLKQRTERTWFAACTMATGLGLLIYILMALAGFLSFGAAIEPNVILNFPPVDVLINVARVLFATSLVLSYPMAFYPLRDSFADMLGLNPFVHRTRTHVCTVLLFAANLAMAYAITDLGLVFQIIGCVTCSIVNCILPGAYYIISATMPAVKQGGCTAAGNDCDAEHQGLLAPARSARLFSTRTLVAASWLLVGLGVFTLFMGLYDTVFNTDATSTASTGR